jgi:tRNA (guanine37-N1)-methyltransferase
MAPPPNSENGPSSKSSSDSASGGVKPLLRFHFLTLFPEVFASVLGSSLTGKAQKKGLVSFVTHSIRDFATDKHRTVDDTPFGGGAGMLMRVDVLHSAWKAAREPRIQGERVATVLLSPQGAHFTQGMAKELARDYDRLILVCGHYEGVDERFVELCVDREVSIGDYVLTGGELPAMVMADTITRLLPGVVGNEDSISQDSLEDGLIKYPQYTRPREYEGMTVPEVLLGGDHGAIKRWRKAQSEARTASKRPDLLKKP